MIFFYFRALIIQIKENLLNENTETMKNYSNHSSKCNIRNGCLKSVVMEQISAFIIFEICIVLISLLIVSSSSLVIYRIIKAQVKKVKYDFAFIILSISDIGVGLFSVPLLGIDWYYGRISQNMPYIARIADRFFTYFPFNFSCLFTTVIAIDRLIVIRLSPRYKNLFTPKRLKVIAIILLLISAITSSTFTIRTDSMQSRRYITIWMSYISHFFVILTGTLCTVVVILTHLYVLYFALRRLDLKILRNNYSRNYNRRRLTNTITCICISQSICVIPYLLFQIVVPKSHIPLKLMLDINPWLGILAYSQCFCNALIILKNKKPRKTFKQTGKEEISIKDQSRMRTRK